MFQCQTVVQTQRDRGTASFSPGGRGRKTTCILLSNSSNLAFTMKCNSWDCVLVPTLDSWSDSDGLFFTTGGIEEGQHVCYLAVCPVPIPFHRSLVCALIKHSILGVILGAVKSTILSLSTHSMSIFDYIVWNKYNIFSVFQSCQEGALLKRYEMRCEHYFLPKPS